MISLLLSSYGILLHGPSSKALLAALTATSTSLASASWIAAIFYSVVGLIVSKVYSEIELTHFPSINS